MKLYELSIKELAELYKEGRATPKEVVEQLLQRIEQLNPVLNAFITVDKKDVFKQTERAVKMLSKKGASPLCGIPIAVKDIFTTKGIRTTCASRILENFVQSYDAEVVRKLYDAGAIIIGKTNMDEFAMGSST